MSARPIPAPLELVFEAVREGEEAPYEREYQRLSETDEDPIGQWLKLAKARGETKETDPVLLYLLVELHRKVDELSRLVQDERPSRLELGRHARIEAIGFGTFWLQEPLLKEGERYYGRIDMPLFPRRDMGVWFTALDARQVRIDRMHERDEKEWNQYVTARERIMIREMRQNRQKGGA